MAARSRSRRGKTRPGRGAGCDRPRGLGGDNPEAAVAIVSSAVFGTNCTDALPYHRLTLGMGSELIIRVVIVVAGAFTIAAASVIIFGY